MAYYNNQGSSGGFYGGQQQQQQPPPYGAGGQQQQQYQQHSNQYQQSYNDPNAWQQPPIQQQQQYNQQQQHNQQQQQQNSYGQQQDQYQQSYGQHSQQPPPQPQAAAPFWDPSAAASLASFALKTAVSSKDSNAMLDMAGVAGKSFLENSSARMIPGLERAMNALRCYFAVDNRYVLQKIKRVLLPFVCKQWKRQQKEVAPTSDNRIPPIAYQLPIHDECAPDLYLPLMSGITFVLLSALMYGTAGKFNPEVIPSVTSWCFFLQIVEVAGIWLCMYAMQAQMAMLDLLSYTGYKYVGLCVNMVAGILMGHNGVFGFSAATGTRAYYVMYLWTASAASYFMLKTMANNIPLQTASQGPKREFAVIGFAIAQFVTMWLMGQTKFL